MCFRILEGSHQNLEFLGGEINNERVCSFDLKYFIILSICSSSLETLESWFLKFEFMTFDFWHCQLKLVYENYCWRCCFLVFIYILKWPVENKKDFVGSYSGTKVTASCYRCVWNDQSKFKKWEMSNLKNFLTMIF